MTDPDIIEGLAAIRARLVVEPLSFFFQIELGSEVHALSPDHLRGLPRCRIVMDPSDFRLWINGILNPQAAFLQSRLKIREGFEAALSLASVLEDLNRQEGRHLS